VTSSGILWPRIAGAILILIGAVFLCGGFYLATLGGSLYYVISGAALIGSGIFYWRRSRAGELLYGLILVATLIWSWIETDGHFWALEARLFAPAVLGLFLALPWIRRGLGTTSWRGNPAIIAAIILAMLAVDYVQFERSTVAEATVLPTIAGQSSGDSDWPNYAGDPQGRHFAPLSQITPENVGKLQVAWVHHSGDSSKGEATPIKIGPTLYSCTPHGIMFAVDAVTGKEKWRRDPNLDASKLSLVTCRGVSYHKVPEAVGLCAERIYAGGPGGVLRAVDAPTGTPCPGFGKDGFVNLLEGMGNIRPSDYTVNSAPTIADGKVIVGAFVQDNSDRDIASGVVRAFDAVTGALDWAWDMGAPDRIGLPPEGQTYTRGTPNAWPTFAVDEKLGLVFIPTGNPSPDQYGVLRRPFDEKYGSAIVALNISDGRERWSYQTTHYDLWDYDVPAQPTLIDLPDGQPALLAGTKRGDIFVLDRRTGKPIVPAPETPVPLKGGTPGERLSKTQPISKLNFFPPPLAEEQMWGATPIDQMLCRIAYKKIRYEGPFTPPGTDRILIYPGAIGGIDWGGVAVDDDHKIVVSNTNDFPVFVQLVPRSEVKDISKEYFPAHNSPYVVRIGLFMGPLNIPCLQPPWGQLAAVDLKTGKRLWRRPIGTSRDSGPFGVRFGPPLLIGTPNMGGMAVTRGGVVFHSATLDQYIRAYDIRTGKELWKHRLPAGGQSTPMTYMAGGKQYVVMTAGGHGLMGTKLGDATIAFRLPD
jgi:membrane-bound PQQ-dependent dehydrogenase (glucose/quinate/shikimate family)